MNKWMMRFVVLAAILLSGQGAKADPTDPQPTSTPCSSIPIRLRFNPAPQSVIGVKVKDKDGNVVFEGQFPVSGDRNEDRNLYFNLPCLAVGDYMIFVETVMHSGSGKIRVSDNTTEIDKGINLRRPRKKLLIDTKAKKLGGRYEIISN